MVILKSVSIVLFFSISAIIHCSAQEKTLPEEARSFVPAGYELLDYIKGDLNADKKIDAIMILKQTGEDTSVETEMNRPLLVLIRQADGSLKKTVRNDKAILCSHCGGGMGDPYQEIVIKPTGFEISFYGGSTWRWSSDYSFQYKPVSKNWYLVKEKQVNFQADNPKNSTQVIISATELGDVPLEKFNIEPAWEDSKWKVLRNRAYFYDNPILGSKPRTDYVQKGFLVTGIRHLKNFIEVYYQTDGEESFQGYILRTDLQLQK